MPHEYTRQRQGRDFALSQYLADTSAVISQTAESTTKTDEEAKTLLHRLEHYRQEAERNAIPVDGHEPPEKGVQSIFSLI